MPAEGARLRTEMEALVARVVVHEATRLVNLFNPARVEIVWR